jgi:hypothetical protein
MPYSDSSHFSDKLSYKILFISSYQSKDMNYATLEQILPFSENRNRTRNFSHPEVLRRRRQRLTGGALLSGQIW